MEFPRNEHLITLKWKRKKTADVKSRLKENLLSQKNLQHFKIFLFTMYEI